MLETGVFGINIGFMLRNFGIDHLNPGLMFDATIRDGAWLTGDQIAALLFSRGFVFDHIRYLNVYPYGLIIQYRNIDGEIIEIHNNANHAGDYGNHWQAVKR